METAMNVISHLVNDTQDSMCGFYRLPQCLPDANFILPAIINVLLVSLATEMFVDMPSMEHEFRKKSVILR